MGHFKGLIWIKVQVHDIKNIITTSVLRFSIFFTLKCIFKNSHCKNIYNLVSFKLMTYRSKLSA